MWQFCILIFLPIFTNYIKINHNDFKKSKSRAITFFFILMMLLLACKAATVGNDTSNYYHMFDNACKSSWSAGIANNSEFGFFVLEKLISYVSTDSKFYMAIIAVITVIPLMLLYRNYVEDAPLTIVLFINMSTFAMFFSGIRQGLCIALGAIAFYFAKNKKLIPFILLIAVAFTIHNSSFMLAFMYPLYHFKITKKWLWFVVPTIAIIFVFNKPIFNFLGTFISDYYTVSTESTGAYTMIVLFLLFATVSYLFPDDGALDKDTIALRNFLLLALVIQLFAPLNNIAMRMNYYYLIFIPLLIPKIIKCSSFKWIQLAKLARVVMIVFFIGYFFYSLINIDSLHVYPYKFFWEG